MDDLTKHIIENDLQPGDKLPTEPELSAMLGVGRGTLREAVRALVSRNILLVRRGAGTFVAERVGVMDDPLGLSFARDKYKLAAELLQLRMILEPEIAALAAFHITDEEIVRLEELCKAVEDSIARGENHAAPDEALHLAIAGHCGNSVIAKLMPSIHLSVEMFVALTRHELLSETIETHRQIVQAIRNRDGFRARDAMRMHLLYNLRLVENYGDTLDQSAESRGQGVPCR
jgi:DNA-binding FadR family transcriptional regulator